MREWMYLTTLLKTFPQAAMLGAAKNLAMGINLDDLAQQQQQQQQHRFASKTETWKASDEKSAGQ